jgi:hypothetical protein
MSGRRINDYEGLPHTSDMSMKSKNYVKHEKSAEGSGHLGMNYPDTTEDIRRDQMAGDGKIKGRAIKPGYRY